jgi:CubicO group peptidase (beta-lactamase class C family)
MISLHRRHVLTGLGVGLMTATGALAASPNEAPKEAFEQRLAQAQQEGRISGLHSLLVSQGGTTIVEHYQPGEDETWGRPLGTVVFAPDVLHDLRSVSKSVVGLLYGIALANGTNSRSLMATERPTVGEPGEKWTYCGGATALLGRLIAKGSGEALLPYARRVLFDPMGFGPAEWMKGDANPIPPRACACCRAIC